MIAPRPRNEAHSAYERLLSSLRARGSRIEENRDGDAMAQCPAHDDGRPSLHINDGDDRALLYCLAGCDTDSVLGTLSMTRDDLFNEPVTNYRYQDRTGQVVRTVTRRPNKKISQSGQTKGVAPLYRVPEVLQAVAQGEVVVLCEGEPDVHAWVRQGVCATTAPAGGGNFDKADVGPLEGADVIAVVDRDSTGDTWARLVQEALRNIVSTLVFRRAKVGKDSSDHIAAGLGLEELEPYTLADPLLADIRTGTWLDSQTFPELSWVVPGVIPEGFGLITGPPKVGKSWLTLGLAMSVAAGRKALGRLPLTGVKPVLLLALEDGDRRMQARCRMLLQGEPIPPQFNYLTSAPPGQVFNLIKSWLAQHQGQEPVVILDTLGKVMPNAAPGESQYQRDYRIGSWLKNLATPGVSILVVHHTKKGESADWMESTSGTNGLNGAADFTINLARERNAPGGLIRVTGRDVEEGEYGLVFSSGCWYLDGDSLQAASESVEAVRKSSTVDGRLRQVLERLGEYGSDGVAPAALATVLGLSPNQVNVYLRRLADLGVAKKIRYGVWAATPTSLSTPPVGVVGVVGLGSEGVPEHQNTVGGVGIAGDEPTPTTPTTPTRTQGTPTTEVACFRHGTPVHPTAGCPLCAAES